MEPRIRPVKTERIGTLVEWLDCSPKVRLLTPEEYAELQAQRKQAAEQADTAND